MCRSEVQVTSRRALVSGVMLHTCRLDQKWVRVTTKRSNALFRHMQTAYTSWPTGAYLFVALEESHNGNGTPGHGPKASKQSHFESQVQAYEDLKKAPRSTLVLSAKANMRSSSTGIILLAGI